MNKNRAKRRREEIITRRTRREKQMQNPSGESSYARKHKHAPAWKSQTAIPW